MPSEYKVMRIFARLSSDDLPEPMRNTDIVIQVLNELGLYSSARKWKNFDQRREVIEMLKNHDPSGEDSGFNWLGRELEKYFVADQFDLHDSEPTVEENILGRWVNSVMKSRNLNAAEACQWIANGSKIHAPNRKDVFKVKELKKAYNRWVKKPEEHRRSNTGAFWIR